MRSAHGAACMLVAVSIANIGAVAAKEPALVGGSILTPIVNVQKAPGQAIVQLKIDPGTVGYLGGSIEASSPSGQHALFASFAPPPYPPGAARKPLAVLLQGPFTWTGLSLYAEPGKWTLTGIQITPSDNSSPISYDTAQIATLFGTANFKVVNKGTPDLAPPQFGKGKILTPTVSLKSASPYLAATLNASDDISGVASVYLQFTLSAQALLDTSSSLDAPVLSGKVVSSAYLPSTTPTGTYTMSAIQVCDYAGNCVNDTSPSDITKAFGAAMVKVTK